MEDIGLPLHGVRVLEVSTGVGAYCGRLLADTGADVTKIELPEGDELRRRPPFGGDPNGQQTSLSFAFYHANKRGVVVDYRDEGNVDSLKALAEGCDVVILTPTARHSIAGVDPATGSISWASPNSLRCFITPFGITGPYRSWRATHLTSYAMGGSMYTQGPVEGPPVVIPCQQMYDQAGTYAAIAVLWALRARREVGAQVIDISAHEVMAYTHFELSQYTSADLIPRRTPNLKSTSERIWKCRDGSVQFTAISERHWFGLLELLGNPEELSDPSWTHPSARGPHHQKIIDVIEPILAQISREDFVRCGQELGVPCALVNTIGDFVRDPQPRGRGFFVRQPSRDMGEFESPGVPFRSSRPLLIPYRRPAPTLGEHTLDAVIGETGRLHRETVQATSLGGIRVISFGTAIAGALAGTVLGDLGADVIKIESPGNPENMRRISQPPGKVAMEPSGAPTSPMFASLNRSTRSVALDMKDPASVELFLRLVEVADVIIENYGPGVMPRWGLTYERIAHVNPGVIMLSLTGFGQTPGPRTHYLAYGSTVASFVGLTQSWGYPHATHCDYVAQAHGVFAVLAALAARDLTGEGAHIDLSQVETAAMLMAPLVLDFAVNGRDSEPLGNAIPGSLLSDVVASAGDDTWLAVEAEDPRDLGRIATVIGRPDLAPDGRPDASPTAADTELIEALRDWAAHHTAHQAMRILQRAGVAAGAVQDAEAIVRDVQHRARSFFVEQSHPDLGLAEYPTSPLRLSKTPAVPRTRTPRLGEHNADVLAEWLGISVEETSPARVKT
jgi:crotonobetainyl-CoA:carnitine CoA-transferase CaiB-like acyl-CoA transferase